MRILLVDDSDFSRATLKHFFTELSDIEIVEAANGIEALEKHRSFKPEIIFMDITMPDLDGLGTLKIISLTDKKVKIIMVSALGNQNYICEEATKYGAFAIMAKPVNRDMALQTLLNAQAQLKAGED
jgi:two-component system chemotaxis response regulator CheY